MSNSNVIRIGNTPVRYPQYGGLVAKSCLTLATPWAVAHQAPLSMEFSRQEYWSGWPFPPPEGLPNPGIELISPTLKEDSLPTEHQGSPIFSLIFPKFIPQGFIMDTLVMVLFCSMRNA